MPAGARYLTFEGQFASAVLGTFRIIRGFADLKDLAEISVPYEMEEIGADGAVVGQQRKLSPQHAELIKKYLQDGSQRFLPEVILSLRSEVLDVLDANARPVGVASKNYDEGIRIDRAWKIKSSHVHRVRIDRTKLAKIRARKLIRRVDGNHRLALAETLQDEASLPTKYLASFCMVLLGPPGEAADDYSESLIFHTINSTALPLESEHALKLILGQHRDYDMQPSQEFAYSPDLHFTRLLRDGFLKLPEPAQSRLGGRPLTSLRAAVRGLLEMDPSIATSLNTLNQYSRELLAALNDIVTRLEPEYPTLCKAEFFVELAARVWKVAPDGGAAKARINYVVAFLEKLAAWIGNDGLAALTEGQSLSKQVLDIFTAVRARVPRRVFLARWYPTSEDGAEFDKAKLRLGQMRQSLKEIEGEDGIRLELIDMGTREGSTFPIHAKMYDAIASSDIIVVDLTGVRPNVCVEAGFALRHHDKGRLIFLFQSSKGHTKVPFDLNTFRYEPIKDTGEIPGKIKPHIKAILRDASAGVI